MNQCFEMTKHYNSYWYFNAVWDEAKVGYVTIIIPIVWNSKKLPRLFVSAGMAKNCSAAHASANVCHDSKPRINNQNARNDIELRSLFVCNTTSIRTRPSLVRNDAKLSSVRRNDPVSNRVKQSVAPLSSYRLRRTIGPKRCKANKWLSKIGRSATTPDYAALHNSWPDQWSKPLQRG